MELNPIQTMLEAQYNLSPSRIASQQGGWASLAYKIEMDDYRAYFLKVYDKKRASTPKLTANLNTYIPITLWLNAHTNLAGKIPVPLLSNNGGYVCEDEQGYYLLYPYIQGETIGEKKPGNDQIQQLAALIAELHRYGSEIPHAVSSLTENYKVPFLNELQEWITNVDKLPEGLREIVAAYELVVQEKINNLRRLSSRLQKCSLPMRLCHTDLHHWNLMLENDRLILIDWEGLKLAPVEADFMSLVDQPISRRFCLSIPRYIPASS